MPFTSSQFWDEDASLVARVYQWQNSGVAQELYPSQPDDLWRFLAFGSIQFTKGPGAIGNSIIRIRREGLVNPAKIWERFLAAADDTSLPGSLQGGETQGEATFYFVSPADVAASGVIIPPRSQIEFVCSNNVFARIEGVIYEAYHLEKFKGLM